MPIELFSTILLLLFVARLVVGSFVRMESGRCPSLARMVQLCAAVGDSGFGAPSIRSNLEGSFRRGGHSGWIVGRMSDDAWTSAQVVFNV